MKFAIVTNVPESIGRVNVKGELTSRGHTVDLVKGEEIELSIQSIDVTVNKFLSYDLVHFAAGFGNFVTKELQRQLISAGISCPNSYTIRDYNTDNKIYQVLEFAKAGILIPKSIRATQSNYANVADILGTKFIVKVPKSSKGAGVYLINNQSDLDKFHSNKSEYLCQEFISYQADYRVHVAGDKIFSPYRRIPPVNDFRANVSLGGHIEKIDPAKIPSLSELAIKTMSAMNLDYGGVDIIEGKDGNLYVLEVNPDPGFKSVDEVLGGSFASSIADFYIGMVEKSNLT